MRRFRGARTGESLSLEVTSVASSGAGCTEDKLEVPGVLAGERVEVELEHVGLQSHHGRLKAVERPSPHRVDPRCRWFLACGGCQLLHADLPHQRALKWNWLRTTLQNAGIDEEPEPVRPAPRGFGYRAMAKFVVQDGGILGSYAPRSHHVVSMQGCLVHHPTIERVANALREGLRTVSDSSLRFIVIRVSRRSECAVVTLVAKSSQAVAVRVATDILVGMVDVLRVELMVRDVDDDVIMGSDSAQALFDRGPAIERMGPVTFDLVGGAFNQVNPEMAEALYAHVVDGLDALQADIADLYAGSGVLAAWLLAAGARRVMSVESGARSASALRRLAEQYEPARIEVLHARVEDVVASWNDRAHAVVNPPRKGLARPVCAGLLDGACTLLVYVSCEPKTLARDLEILTSGPRRFEIARVTPFDLFPQTRHLETVVVLRRPRGA
ncbi:MAG: 23S rRNA (uracil(1939)-C(5))-methyltransferase RlmD [Myxococcota bacterium]